MTCYIGYVVYIATGIIAKELGQQIAWGAVVHILAYCEETSLLPLFWSTQ